jgi:hypothetical protein
MPALNIDRAGSPLFEQLLDPQKLRNQSLAAVLARLTHSAHADAIAITLGLGMAATMLVVARRIHNEVTLLSATICWTLLISPVSEDHYFALLLLPLMTLVALALRGPKPNFLRAVLLLFALASVLAACNERAKFFGALCWATMIVWLALLVIGLRNINEAAA